MSSVSPFTLGEALIESAGAKALSGPVLDADLERRFGALRRLYGAKGYERLRGAAVAVVGLGGVGSWAAEALARSGVASLVLIDLDHVAESNINRQVQALGATVGMSKVQALRERINDIHPGCQVLGVEEFVDEDNWPQLLPAPVSVVIDACDQVRAKAAMAAWSISQQVPLVCVGAAGGKRAPQAVEVADLADVTHDPLLASLRQRLRQRARREQAEPSRTKAGTVKKMGVCCVFSREAVQGPLQPTSRLDEQACEVDADAGSKPGGSTAPVAGDLSCHGYGSSVTVTATFGMVAANQAMAFLLA